MRQRSGNGSVRRSPVFPYLLGMLLGLAVFHPAESVAGTPKPGAGGATITLADGKLTARTVALPVSQVLDELRRLTGARVRWVAQQPSGPVTLEFTDLPLPQALERMLQRNFLIVYSASGEARPAEIWIWPSGTEQQPALDPTAERNLSVGPQPTPLRKGNAARRRMETPGRSAIAESPAIPPEQAVELNLAEEPPSVRLDAVHHLALHAAENPDAREILLTLARGDDDPEVREAASRALAWLR